MGGSHQSPARFDHDEWDTAFRFVPEGIQAAPERAVDSANGQDVGLSGGVAKMRQCLCAGSVDEMHIAVSPVLVGSGERLLTRF